MKRIAKSLAVVAVSAGLLAGCGGNSQSAAADKVCSARTDLHNSIDSVKTDVSSLNFGKAKDGLADVQKSFNNLVQSAKQLKGEEAKTLQPQIDSLKTNIENLTNVSSLTQLTSRLGTISSQIQSLYTQITDTLKCK
jgi:predicted  nucleic acid-binding Zn-ribbon protein